MSTVCKEVAFVTSNMSKVEDVQSILADTVAFKFIHHYVELPELQASSEEISINKCMTAVAIVQNPVVIDDTMLSFNGLNGLPGPYIKAFVSQIGLEGLVRILSDYEDKTAIASCTFAYTRGPRQPIQLFTGSMYGKIVMPSMDIGFVDKPDWGYVFHPDGCDVNYAFLEQTKKNTMSHRYKALMQLKNYLMQEDSGA